MEDNNLKSALEGMDLVINNFSSLLPTPSEINDQIEEIGFKLEFLDLEIEKYSKILNAILAHQKSSNIKSSDVLKEICFSIMNSLETICLDTVEKDEKLDVDIKILSDYQQNLNEMYNNLLSQGLIQEPQKDSEDRNQRLKSHLQKINAYLESQSY